MARLGVVLVLLYPCLPAVAADPAPPTPDLSGLTGFWKPESVVYDGAEQFADAKAREAITLVVKDNEYRIYFCKDNDKDLHIRLVTAEVKVDVARKTIELTIRDGPRKGQACHGIYEVKAGKLRVCYGPVEKPRPTAFAAPAGSGFFCETWVPEKP